MNDYFDSINKHYSNAGSLEKLRGFLETKASDGGSLSVDDLTVFDELHIGGRGETRNLANLANVSEGKEVLDVGSGLGGPARTLANDFGAQVTGLDLTEEFCKIANELTFRVRLDEKVKFVQGSALDIPFENESYDIIWNQFAAMNIPNRETMYREIFRVLRPGGIVAIHEVMGANDEPLQFPALWAPVSAISFVRKSSWVRTELADVGLKEKSWTDLSEFSIRWLQKKKSAAEAAAISPSDGFLNVLDDLMKKKIVVIQTVWQKPADKLIKVSAK